MDKKNKPNRLKYIALVLIGSLSVALGAVGIIMPVLPTTPFVLLAAACFSLSNEKLARKLEESKLFGSYLRHWRTHEGIPMQTKIRAIIWLWLGLGISAVIVKTPVVIILLGVIGTIVTTHLLLIRTRKEESIEVLTTTGTDT